MADPLSVSASVVGIIGFALGSVRETINLIQGVLGAPSAVNTLRDELNSLNHVLNSLNDIVKGGARQKQNQHHDIFALLEIPVQQCVLTTHSIREELRPYIKSNGAAKTATWKGFSWFMHEKEFLVLKQSLASQKSALEIALSVVNMSNIRDIRQDILALRKDLPIDNESTDDPEFDGSSIQGSDYGFAIRSFLLDTESIINEEFPETDMSIHLESNPDDIAQPDLLPPLSEEQPSLVISGEGSTPEDIVALHIKDGKQKGKEALRTSSEKVFGVNLMESFAKSGDLVPAFVSRCIEILDLHGLEVNMIYSLTGKVSILGRIKSSFDYGGVSAPWPFDVITKSALHSIAASLKQFLREIPQGLLSGELYSALISAAKTEELFVRLFAIRDVVYTLNNVHFSTLKTIVLHLRRVADHSSVNLMTPRNIAISFGSTFVRHASISEELTNSALDCMTTEMLIEYAHEIFEISE